MNIQASLEAPRFTKLTFEGCDVQIESRMPEPVRSELERLGHQVQVVAPFSQRVGGGQAVMRNVEGVNFGDRTRAKTARPCPSLLNSRL